MSKGTVLVLEDAATNREIMSKMLKSLGYDVLTAANGEEGFKIVEKCEEDGTKIAAVLSDMLMPLVDGPTFVRHLRDNEAYEELPVIFMTTGTDRSFLLQAKELKAGYILKPVQAKALGEQLGALVK